MLTMCLDENTMNQNIFGSSPMLTIYRSFRDIFILRGLNEYEEKDWKYWEWITLHLCMNEIWPCWTSCISNDFHFIKLIKKGKILFLSRSSIKVIAHLSHGTHTL